MIKGRALAYIKNRAPAGCRVYLFAIGLSLISPWGVFAQAPVVDDSDNFAIMDEQQAGYPSPAPKKYSYDAEDTQSYQGYDQDDEKPLAVDDGNNTRTTESNDLASTDVIQNLQKEMQELRGQLEVQAHQLKQLKEQQLNFYKDLDARLQNNSGTIAKKIPDAPQAVAPSANIATPSSPKASPGVSIAPSGIPGKQGAYIKSSGKIAVAGNRTNEEASYLAAYELVKNKQNDQALIAMQEFMVLYPRGMYTANAHYWLGELYMVKNNYPKAIEQFATVLDQFPKSGKSAASTLKLGYALAATGRTAEARQRLQQVIHQYPKTAVAQLASVKLEALRVS